MNKSELIDVLSNKTGVSKMDAGRILDAFTETVIEELLEKNESISLVGFGTFKVASRSARAGRNPQSGAEIQIPASKNISFKASTKLKVLT